MEVVAVGGVLSDFEAEFVALAVAGAAADAAAGHPRGEGTGVVVAADARLRAGLASEFRGADDEGVVEHALAFQIAQECGRAGVEDGAPVAVVAGEVFVAVPVGADGLGLGVFRAAVDLHEADAALDESAGEEALPAEGADVLVVEGVEPADGLAFRGDVGDFGGAELETRGEFVGRDARFEFGVFRAGFGVPLVQERERFQGLALTLGRCGVALGRKEIGDDGAARIAAERGGLVDGGEEARAPVDGAAGRQSAHVGQHHEGGQVARFRAEAIRHPRAHGGEAGHGEARVHHEARGAVEGRLAGHGMDEGHVVHAGGEVGEEVAHPLAALAMLAEFPEASLAIAGLRREELQLPRGVKGLAVAPLQFGFVVPRVHLAQSAGAEDLDDGLGLRRIVGRSRAEGIARRGAEVAAVVQQCGQRDTAQSAAEFPEELAAGAVVDLVAGATRFLFQPQILAAFSSS